MVMSLDAEGNFQFVKPRPAVRRARGEHRGDNSPLRPRAGENILRCRAAVTSADQVAEVEARGWDVTTKKTLVGQAPAADNPGIAIGTTPAAAAAPSAPPPSSRPTSPTTSRGR